MFTVCPKCTLTLAVTATDLRVGQGYVRCGRCANVFNALLGLSEEPDSNTSSTQPRPALQVPETPANEPQPSETTASQAMQSPESVADEGIEEPAISSVSGYAIDTDPGAGTVNESQGTGTFETIVLEGDGILQTEEFIAEGAIDSEFAAVAQQVAAIETGHLGETRRSAADDSVAQLPATDPETGEAAVDLIATPAVTAPGTSPLRSALLVIAGALLAVLLAVQAIHHWRNDLAARPQWYQPLTRIYGALGMTLTPTWDLAAYDVRQLGAATEGNNGNAIRVRVSVANRALRSQPTPILRLTLLDRYGKKVAARDLLPADYLPKDQRERRFLDAEQRIDAEIRVVDPGPDATSFELDVCLALAAGGLRCANDAPILAPTGP